MSIFDGFRKSPVAAKPGPAPSDTAKPGLDHQDAAWLGIPAAAPKPQQRLLFVGVGSDWFHVMAGELRRLHPEWGCEPALSMPDAIAALATGHFYAVIFASTVAADASQLAAVEKWHNSVRVVLCASTDRAEIARWTAIGAQPLSQAIEAAVLAGHISRLARVQEWMSDAGMKKLLAQCRKLPTLPRLYSQVTAELSSPNGSIDVVAQCIAKDPVMASKLLQVVNSAFFALGREISEPTEAVLFLGAERTRSLILLAGVFTQFENVKCTGFSTDQVWNHSLQVGAMARTVALTETKNSKLAEAAFTAGLVHDMGKLILAANVPVMCASIQQLYAGKNLTRREAELQVFGTTHAELAACLLGTWGLPLPVLEAVAWHHAPTRSADQRFTLLTAVHVANVFAYELSASATAEAQPEKFCHDYLDQIGLGDRRNDWRKACNLPAKQEEDAEHSRLRARRAAKVN